jgi:hypothetical protein
LSALGSSTKYRLVPRAPGDTTPLDPKIADALRKAGMDPDRFTVTPLEPGEDVAPVAGLFTPGARLEHTFAFETLNGALSAIERIVDEGCSARISRQGAKWIVVFDGPGDPSAQAAAAHEKIASRIAGLGADDRGFSHLTMNVTTSVRNADR